VMLHASDISSSQRARLALRVLLENDFITSDFAQFNEPLDTIRRNVLSRVSDTTLTNVVTRGGDAGRGSLLVTVKSRDPGLRGEAYNMSLLDIAKEAGGTKSIAPPAVLTTAPDLGLDVDDPSDMGEDIREDDVQLPCIALRRVPPQLTSRVFGGAFPSSTAAWEAFRQYNVTLGDELRVPMLMELNYIMAVLFQCYPEDRLVRRLADVVVSAGLTHGLRFHGSGGIKFIKANEPFQVTHLPWHLKTLTEMAAFSVMYGAAMDDELVGLEFCTWDVTDDGVKCTGRRPKVDVADMLLEIADAVWTSPRPVQTFSRTGGILSLLNRFPDGLASGIREASYLRSDHDRALKGTLLVCKEGGPAEGWLLTAPLLESLITAAREAEGFSLRDVVIEVMMRTDLVALNGLAGITGCAGFNRTHSFAAHAETLSKPVDSETVITDEFAQSIRDTLDAALGETHKMSTSDFLDAIERHAGPNSAGGGSLSMPVRVGSRDFDASSSSKNGWYIAAIGRPWPEWVRDDLRKEWQLRCAGPVFDSLKTMRDEPCKIFSRRVVGTKKDRVVNGVKAPTFVCGIPIAVPLMQAALDSDVLSNGAAVSSWGARGGFAKYDSLGLDFSGFDTSLTEGRRERDRELAAAEANNAAGFPYALKAWDELRKKVRVRVHDEDEFEFRGVLGVAITHLRKWVLRQDWYPNVAPGEDPDTYLLPCDTRGMLSPSGEPLDDVTYVSPWELQYHHLMTTLRGPVEDGPPGAKRIYPMGHLKSGELITSALGGFINAAWQTLLINRMSAMGLSVTLNWAMGDDVCIAYDLPRVYKGLTDVLLIRERVRADVLEVAKNLAAEQGMVIHPHKTEQGYLKLVLSAQKLPSENRILPLLSTERAAVPSAGTILDRLTTSSIRMFGGWDSVCFYLILIAFTSWTRSRRIAGHVVRKGKVLPLTVTYGYYHDADTIFANLAWCPKCPEFSGPTVMKLLCSVTPTDAPVATRTRNPKRVILAPSGSGKTFWSNGRKDVVDGDDVIAETIGWPTTPQWWTGPDADAVHERNRAALRAWVSDNPDHVVVFNGELPPDMVGAVVIPTESAHRFNMMRRRANPTGQPDQWDELRANAMAVERFAVENGIPIFIDEDTQKSFDDAFALLNGEVRVSEDRPPADLCEGSKSLWDCLWRGALKGAALRPPKPEIRADGDLEWRDGDTSYKVSGRDVLDALSRALPLDAITSSRSAQEEFESSSAPNWLKRFVARNSPLQNTDAPLKTLAETLGKREISQNDGRSPSDIESDLRDLSKLERAALDALGLPPRIDGAGAIFDVRAGGVLERRSDEYINPLKLMGRLSWMGDYFPLSGQLVSKAVDFSAVFTSGLLKRCAGFKTAVIDAVFAGVEPALIQTMAIACGATASQAVKIGKGAVSLALGSVTTAINPFSTSSNPFAELSVGPSVELDSVTPAPIGDVCACLFAALGPVRLSVSATDLSEVLKLSKYPSYLSAGLSDLRERMPASLTRVL